MVGKYAASPKTLIANCYLNEIVYLPAKLGIYTLTFNNPSQNYIQGLSQTPNKPAQRILNDLGF